MLSGVGSSLGSIGTIAGGILTSQVFMAIARQIGQMVTSAISATAQMQNMQMMLTNLQARELIRSGDFVDMNEALKAAAPLAKATMNELERVATLSPYQLENVSNTYKMAMAFGYTSKEATVFTKALLTMGAGVGASGEMLDRMAYNLAQVRLQGKVTAVDIRQLAMAGFDLNDVLKYVGKQMGVNIETHEDFNKAIADGTVTWEDFTKYFAEYADKNFGGAAERMSRTLEGLKSTFKDVFLLTMPKILGPSAELVTGLLNDILNSFLSLSDSGSLERFGEKFAQDLFPAINSIRTFLFDVGVLKSAFEDERGWDGGKKISLMDKFVDGTEDFKTWAEGIDWQVVSDEIVAGIDEIDWSGIGAKLNEGISNSLSGVGTIASFDFTDIANSLTEGFADAVITGIGGDTNWDGVMQTWTENFDQLKLIFDRVGPIVTTSLDSAHIAGTSKAALMGAAIPAAMTSPLATGGLAIANVILNWLPIIGTQLEAIKKLFFNMMQAAAQQAIRALLGMQSSVIGAVQTFLTAVQNVIKPIVMSVTVNTPNWDKLIAEAQAGMEALRAAMHGGTGSVGGRSTNQGGGGATGGGGGGNGSAHGGNQTGFAKGGISDGPKRGYQALLHGREAVIPLEGGAIPVEIKEEGAQAGLTVNVYVENVSSDIDIYEMAYKVASVIAERS